MSRSPNLTEPIIAGVVQILHSWEGKLTWKLLIDAIKQKSASNYSRQALKNHPLIYKAYSLSKKPVGKTSEKPRGEMPPLRMYARLIELEAENVRLKSENSNLMEQQIRFIYNAHLRGICGELLNQPLQPVNRAVSEPQSARPRMKLVPRQ